MKIPENCWVEDDGILQSLCALRRVEVVGCEVEVIIAEHADVPQPHPQPRIRVSLVVEPSSGQLKRPHFRDVVKATASITYD